ncbi:Zn-ribbon domain-containing protein [Methanolobus sp. ZRKC3]|uniref:Zn-ribbon domain-containing protein n=1 Tax=Methanolobus sp. ZRKC3 TaxID=3125786 RepID=UPI00325044E1
MPHKCTRCESIFIDGASVILTGCPNCGWNKFLYVKDEELENAQEMESDSVEGPKGHIIDESSQHSEESENESAPAEKFIREIDELIGADKEERSVTEEDEERVESVRILGPGSYELNLDSLLDRKEIVMAIKEDGTYALHLGSVFNKNSGKKKKK